LAAPLNADELFKALLTALGAALAARLSAVFELLTDPASPRKALDDAKQSLSLIDSWTKVMDQLNRLPASPSRDQLQAKLQGLLEQLNESQQRCLTESFTKREKLLKLLGLLRMRAPQNFAKGALSFCFYLSVILTVQSIHLYLTGMPLAPALIPILAVLSAMLWAFSAPGTPPSLSTAGASARTPDRLAQPTVKPPNQQPR
jgi:hypothetical protein